MARRAKPLLFGLMAILIAGIGLQQLLTWWTARRVPPALAKLERQIETMLPEPDAPNSTNRANAQPAADDPDAVAAQWRMLFTQTRAGAEDFWARWEDAMLLPLQVRWGDKQYDELSEDDIKLLEELVLEIEDLLRQIRDLSQPDMPACQFSVWKEINGYPECEMYLSADLLLATNQEDYTRAVGDIIALAKMCDSNPFVDYPFRMHHGTQQCLRDAIASGTVDDPLWDTLLRQLEASRDHEIFPTEWAHLVRDQLDWYARLPNSRFAATSGAGRIRQEIMLYGYTYGATPLMNRDMARFGDVMSQLMPLMAVPYYEAQPEVERIREDFNISPPWELPPWTDPGGWMISTLVHERFDGQAGVEAEIDLARMAILLERYRRETSAYPESLEAITPGLGGQLPVNPFLGEPYQYERVEDTYRLWYEDLGPATEGGPDVRRRWIWAGEHEFPSQDQQESAVQQ